MKAQIVTFHCVLKNKFGTVLGSSFNHDVLTSSGQSNAPLSGLAEGLQNLTKGERRHIFLRAEDAYGYYDPRLVITKTADEFPKSKTPILGEQHLLSLPSGGQRPFRITKIDGDLVTLDGNHPLAGQDLVFEIEALAAREATPQELDQADPTLEPLHVH